jgi:hypothetical protein
MSTHADDPRNAFGPDAVTARPSLLARLRALPHRTALDRALAAGIDPLATPAIAARADVLRSRREREALASAIYLMLKDANHPPPMFTPRVPVARDAVQRSRPELLALAAELRQAADVSPRGVATTRLLVADGTGPLYTNAGSRALGAAVLRARAWL